MCWEMGMGYVLTDPIQTAEQVAFALLSVDGNQCPSQPVTSLVTNALIKAWRGGWENGEFFQGHKSQGLSLASMVSEQDCNILNPVMSWLRLGAPIAKLQFLHSSWLMQEKQLRCLKGQWIWGQRKLSQVVFPHHTSCYLLLSCLVDHPGYTWGWRWWAMSRLIIRKKEWV